MFYGIDNIMQNILNIHTEREEPTMLNCIVGFNNLKKIGNL